MPGRRWPPALARHLLPRLGLAALGLVMAAVGITGAVLGARDSERFERQGALAVAEVMVEGGDDSHVPVRFVVDGRDVTAEAPVAERGPYEPGEQVEILYDPSRPQVARLVEQPFDLATPLAFFVGLALLAVTYAAVVWWRTVRLLRLARSRHTAFAFAGRLQHEERKVRGEQTWVLLEALDGAAGAPPVASVPILPGQPLPDASPFAALVKGDVRDGGMAVVLAGDEILWPSGRVRVGR
jgi:hypothetical protein